jgi:hypothetical protein
MWHIFTSFGTERRSFELPIVPYQSPRCNNTGRGYFIRWQSRSTQHKMGSCNLACPNNKPHSSCTTFPVFLSLRLPIVTCMRSRTTSSLSTYSSRVPVVTLAAARYQSVPQTRLLLPLVCVWIMRARTAAADVDRTRFASNLHTHHAFELYDHRSPLNSRKFCSDTQSNITLPPSRRLSLSQL